jgi:hypothetical protein
VESNRGNAAKCGSPEEIKYCAHRFQGCISQNGYLCLHAGPTCQPIDSNGRRFVVREWLENGQRFTTRDFLTDSTGIPMRPVIDAEKMNAALAMVAELRGHRV